MTLSFADLFYSLLFDLIPFPAIAVLMLFTFFIAVLYVSNIPKEASMLLGLIMVIAFLGFSNVADNILLLGLIATGIIIGIGWITIIKKWSP